VFMQLCIKLIIMEESTKKIFKPKFELVQECNGLVSIHLVSTLLRLYFKGQKTGTTQEDHQMLVVCRTLRDICPNALGVRPEELCQDKARNLLYNLSDSLREHIQTLREVCLSQGKGQRRSVLSILVLYLSSTQNI
jgi:hypothetical protein